MPPDFTGHQVSALRNTVGNGIIIRLFDFRLLHDLRFDELAAAKGIVWNAVTPYLVIHYPSVQETLENGRLKLGPPGLFKATSFSSFTAAQDKYINECHGQASKIRRQWKVGKTDNEQDE